MIKNNSFFLPFKARKKNKNKKYLREFVSSPNLRIIDNTNWPIQKTSLNETP